MRRNGSPYNGKQFLLNKNTGEIHDLDNEQPGCKIDEIHADHISMHDSFIEATVAGTFINVDPDGCYYCLNAYHTH